MMLYPGPAGGDVFVPRLLKGNSKGVLLLLLGERVASVD